MLVGFDKWWQEDGRMIDPDTEDVPWFDKRKGLAEMAFEAGIKCGMARAGNYTADDAEMPERVDFANGRFVRIVDNPAPGVHYGVFLEVGMKS
jgi:hypothetical protein